jgi:hypothetical protein
VIYLAVDDIEVYEDLLGEKNFEVLNTVFLISPISDPLPNTIASPTNLRYHPPIHMDPVKLRVALLAADPPDNT